MLLAQESQSDNLEIYIALLDQYFSTHNGEIKKFFKNILMETKSLLTKKISYYEVDSEIYPIVTFLADKDEEFFTDLNIKSVSDSEFEKLRNYLSEGSLLDY